MKITKTYILAATLAAMAGGANAATIANGGFESPGTFVGGFQNTSTLDGWTVSGNVDLINTYWTPAEGSYSLDLNGTSSSASISQVITGLVAGAAYDIMFEMSGNPAGAPDEKKVTVSTDEGSTAYSYNKATMGNTLVDMKWITMTYSFVAAGTSTTLTFDSTQSPTSWGPALDDIRITTASPAPIPLPAGGLQLLTGLGALALRRRKG